MTNAIVSTSTPTVDHRFLQVLYSSFSDGRYKTGGVK
jgi:hypothetical protein